MTTKTLDAQANADLNRLIAQAQARVDAAKDAKEHRMALATLNAAIEALHELGGTLDAEAK